MLRKLLWSTPALTVLGLFAACGDDNDESPANVEETGTAPAHLVDDDGGYSDERFIDMIVPHHTMAIEHAQVLLERSQDAALRAMAER